MFSLKKTAVAVLALGSSAAFAGTMGPVCTPGNVTVPCESTAWDFGVTALYLQPVYDADWSYYGRSTNGNNVYYNDMNSAWGWGFKLDGSYHFSTGNDLTVNWSHYDHTTNSVYGTNQALDLQQKWDAVNVEFGQHVDFGEFKDIRFHGGVQFARIKHNFDYVESAVHASTYDTNYSGFGPRAGADMAYNWGNGFAMYANTAAAILVGTADHDGSVTNLVHGSHRAMVPELEAKLGGTYTYVMSSGNLTLDVGYMWMNYFNAQHSISDSATAVPTVVESDFAMHGPFVGLKWVGNV